jgi:hypothetical protein
MGLLVCCIYICLQNKNTDVCYPIVLTEAADKSDSAYVKILIYSIYVCETNLTRR